MEKLKSIFKNKLVVVLLVIFILLFIVFIVLNIFNKNESQDINDVDVKEDIVDEEDVYVVISINPKIMIKINNNIIVEIYPLNEDASIFTNEDFDNIDLDEGINKIIQIATDNSFVDDDLIIEISSFKYESQDEEIETLSLVKTKIIDNGIKVESVSLSEKEIEEVLEVTKKLESDILLEEDKDTSLEEDLGSDKNPNNDLDESEELEEEDEVDTETEEVKIKLDINNILNQKEFKSSYFYVDSSYAFPSEYSSHIEYFDAMIKKIEDGVLEEYIDALPCPAFLSDGECEDLRKEILPINTKDKLLNEKQIFLSDEYDGNYYKYGHGVISIESDGVYTHGPNAPLLCEYGVGFPVGCGYMADGPYDFSLTSDSEKYYLTYTVDSKVVSCTASSNMEFKCDNYVYKDDKTNEVINIYKP